jgi:hypothetical protein
VRRAMKAIDEAASGQWMKVHLKASYEPLLQEPWILDVDTTVKPLYGHQQDAKVGYNPTKPGRPSLAPQSRPPGSSRRPGGVLRLYGTVNLSKRVDFLGTPARGCEQPCSKMLRFWQRPAMVVFPLFQTINRT